MTTRMTNRLSLKFASVDAPALVVLEGWGIRFFSWNSHVDSDVKLVSVA